MASIIYTAKGFWSRLQAWREDSKAEVDEFLDDVD